MAAVNAGSAATLHYIFDPLCGWCYAAAPLLQAASTLPGLAIALHGGGMLAGSNRRPVTPQWRAHVLPHDQRIAALSGQPFGDAYFDGLLRDSGAVLDSAPPTTAILAAEALAGRGLQMLARQQRAHYVEGRRIADASVLQALAADIGLVPEASPRRAPRSPVRPRRPMWPTAANGWRAWAAMVFRRWPWPAARS